MEVPVESRDLAVPRKCACGRVEVLMVRNEDYNAWLAGDLVQFAFPYLTAAERELFISRTCGECWKTLFGNPFGNFEEDEE